MLEFMRLYGSLFPDLIGKQCMGEKDKTDPRLSAWRKVIIEGVLTKGIKPSVTLAENGRGYLGSSDSCPIASIYGCLVRPQLDYPCSGHFKMQLDLALYNDSNSVIPVTTERPKEDRIFLKKRKTEVDKRLIQERVLSSFLVISNASNEESKMPFRLTVRHNHIKPEEFKVVVFPDKIWKEYSSQTTNGNPFVRIRVVKPTEKKLWHAHYKFMVPNYEQILIEMLQQHDIAFWIHGVRLPTLEDLKV